MTFQSEVTGCNKILCNSNIKKDGSDEYHTNKINPLPKNTTSTLLNINTKFRKNFYNTKATDFVLDLPEEFKNVVSITVVSVQVPNSNYTFCSSYGTNEFTVELFDLSQNNTTPNTNALRETKVIKIKEGIYTGPILEDYLNANVFSKNQGELARIGCKYDGISRKFRFFRDLRDRDNGGMPDDDKIKRHFNLDFRLNADKFKEDFNVSDEELQKILALSPEEQQKVLQEYIDKDFSQQIELSDFDVTDKEPNAQGGIVGLRI